MSGRVVKLQLVDISSPLYSLVQIQPHALYGIKFNWQTARFQILTYRFESYIPCL